MATNLENLNKKHYMIYLDIHDNFRLPPIKNTTYCNINSVRSSQQLIALCANKKLNDTEFMLLIKYYYTNYN